MPEMKAVLFDLDGTLADTARDLGHALNVQLERHGRAPLPYDAIRPVASHGARGLLYLGFGLKPEDGSFDSMRAEYLALYAEHLSYSTTLFPGMAELLAQLEARAIPWGVVTNKPARFTDPLLRDLGLTPRAACIISGDTCAYPKPHPASLLLAAERLQLAPARCLYVGDAERDIQAAVNAGMVPIIARYGYIDAHDTPATWGAAGEIEHPADLWRYIEQPQATPATGARGADGQDATGEY